MGSAPEVNLDDVSKTMSLFLFNNLMDSFSSQVGIAFDAVKRVIYHLRWEHV